VPDMRCTPRRLFRPTTCSAPPRASPAQAPAALAAAASCRPSRKRRRGPCDPGDESTLRFSSAGTMRARAGPNPGPSRQLGVGPVAADATAGSSPSECMHGSKPIAQGVEAVTGRLEPVGMRTVSVGTGPGREQVTQRQRIRAPPSTLPRHGVLSNRHY
jgi:hypothetical protein